MKSTPLLSVGETLILSRQLFISEKLILLNKTFEFLALMNKM